MNIIITKYKIDMPSVVKTCQWIKDNNRDVDDYATYGWLFGQFLASYIIPVYIMCVSDNVNYRNYASIAQYSLGNIISASYNNFKYVYNSDILQNEGKLLVYKRTLSNFSIPMTDAININTDPANCDVKLCYTDIEDLLNKVYALFEIDTNTLIKIQDTTMNILRFLFIKFLFNIYTKNELLDSSFNKQLDNYYNEIKSKLKDNSPAYYQISNIKVVLNAYNNRINSY